MTCKQCSHLIVPLDKAGRRRVLASSAYECGFPEEAMPAPAVPHAVSRAYGCRWPPSARRCMEGSDGEGCPTFAPREAPMRDRQDGHRRCANDAPAGKDQVESARGLEG